MASRVERLARNEALFREVNRSVENVHADWHAYAPSTEMRIVCECSRADCAEVIEVDAATYTAVRRDATRFLIVPGHEEPDVERVVESHRTHAVVEKTAGIEFVT
jgi:hypothetical protein